MMRDRVRQTATLTHTAIGGTHMTHMTHIIITNREIESYDRVADLAHAVHGLAMIGRAMTGLEVHTVSLSIEDTARLNELIKQQDEKTTYLRANHKIMSKADVKSEMSNVRQLRDAIKGMI